MPSLEDLYHDFLTDEAFSKCIQENIEICQDDIDEKVFEQKCKKVIENYEITDYWDKTTEWNNLDIEKKLDYCKQLLEEISTDTFPLQRQVSVLQNLINIDLKDLNYYLILECAFFNKDTLDNMTITYNPIIPAKHYIELIKKLQKESNIGALQIPLEKSTLFLGELFQIWFMYKSKGMTYYEISNKLIPYDKLNFEPKQVERKLKAIRKLTT